MNLLHLINGNNYGVFNRQIARKIGLHTTIVLSELIDKFEFFQNQGKLVALKDQIGEWFYLTAECIEERTSLGEKAQRTAIEQLSQMGFIKKILSGLPAKRYFQLNQEKIFEFLLNENNFTSSSKRPNLLPPLDGSCTVKRPTTLYKEPKQEPKEEIPPIPLKGEVEIEAFGKFVKLKKEEFEGFCKIYGRPVVMDMIEQINDYLSSTGKKPYKDYAATIRQWIKRKPEIKPLPPMEAEYKKQMHPDPETPKTQNQKDLSWIEGIMWSLRHLQRTGRVIMDAKFIEFPEIPEAKFYYGDNGFRERVLSTFRKMDIIIDPSWNFS